MKRTLHVHPVHSAGSKLILSPTGKRIHVAFCRAYMQKSKTKPQTLQLWKKKVVL